MANKAGGKPTTSILLSEAMARAVSAYQKRDFAERQLWKWLSAGELHWHSECLEGSKRNCDPGSGDPKFWHEPVLAPPAPGDPVVFFNLRNLIITWDKSCAQRLISSTSSYTFYRIEVAEDDLTKLLPASPHRREKTSKRKWRLDEVAPVVDEMFPGGVPEDKSTAELVQQLGNELERRGIRGVSVTTMERALGRR